MYLTGHLAMGYLAAAGPALAKQKPVDIKYALVPALIGAVSPDAVDKSLQALEVTAHSRTVGHSFLVFAALFLGWKWLRPHRPDIARPFGWWLAGVASHLGADLLNDMIRGLEARGHFFTGWPAWPITDADSVEVLLEIGDHVRVHPTLSSLEIGVYAMTLAVILAGKSYVDTAAID